MVARSVSVVMRTRGLYKLTPWSVEERKSGLSRMKVLKVSGVRVRCCVGKGVTSGWGGVGGEGVGSPPTRGPASSPPLEPRGAGAGASEGGGAL